MLFPVVSDPFLADTLELGRQGFPVGDGIGRVSGKAEAGAQPLQLSLAQRGEQRLAVGAAVQRKRHAHGGHRTQPVRARHLVEEHQLVLVAYGQIHRLAGLAGKLLHVGVCDLRDAKAGGIGDAHQRRAQAHAGGGRRGDHEVLRIQRVDDALHGGAGQAKLASQLAQAQSFLPPLQRAQHFGRACYDADTPARHVGFGPQGAVLRSCTCPRP